jgi:hypothetical protein
MEYITDLQRTGIRMIYYFLYTIFVKKEREKPWMLFVADQIAWSLSVWSSPAEELKVLLVHVYMHSLVKSPWCSESDALNNVSKGF